ncbi:MAG: DUF5672 family protein [Leptothrix sp. (in: b-proteobacteria)]
MKLNLPSLTLVCVDGRHPELALYALQRCMNQIDFGAVVLFSKSGTACPLGVELVSIDGDIHSSADYSEFMINRLPDHIRTDFVLVVQWDGFILDASLWRDEFLDSDYIGPVWQHLPVEVGNGGFSLRSRRLLLAAQAMNMAPTHPEDYVLCCTHRVALEAAGLVFATPELANQFAFESDNRGAATFGFHSFNNFHRAMDDQQLADYLARCPRDILLSDVCRGLIKNALKAGRVKAAMEVARRRFKLGGLRTRLDLLNLVSRTPFYWLRYRANRRAAPFTPMASQS